MSTKTLTLSMSSDTTPPITVTDKARLQLPFAAWFYLVSIAVLAGGAWFTLRADVTRQAATLEASVTRQNATIEANRLEAQRQITELRTDTKESLGTLTTEQKSQRDLLIRIDENIKRLPR